MGHRSAIIVSLALVGGAARAAPTPSYQLVADGGSSGPMFARQVVPASASAPTGLAKTRTIYLNHLGVTLSPGTNDSHAQTSTIVSRPSQVPAWNASPADWAATVACMKEIWAPFDVAVTDVDPGSAPHVEAVFGGSPADVGLTGNFGGISPFTSDCSVIEHSIVFAFTDNLGKQPRTICEVMAQEIAHSYGLDHELVASDPMTYLSYAGHRAFQDQDAACGETKARPCGISGTTCRASQNSYQLLLSRVGAANRDNVPPSVAITAPGESTTVDAGFTISASVADNVAVSAVAFYLDGDLLATQIAAPYRVATDPALGRGAHTIVIEATDADGNTTTEQRDITIAGEATTTGRASAAGLGCAASGGGSPFALIAIVLGMPVVIRRRAHSARRDRTSGRALCRA
jgi:hypothetical protein